MRFPIAIETGDADHAYGVVVPDIPGCFSAGDTLDEAMDNAREAIALALEDILDGDDPLPAASSLETLQADPEYKGWTWAVVDVNTEDLDQRTERINISLPRRVLRRVDQYVKTSYESRSGFLGRAAMDALRERSAAGADLVPSTRKRDVGRSTIKKVKASDRPKGSRGGSAKRA